MSAFERAIVDLVKEGGKAFLQSARKAFETELAMQQSAFEYELDKQRIAIEQHTARIRSGAANGGIEKPSLTRLQVAYRYLGVKDTDPDEMIAAVYRAKAKVLHPDNGATGNTKEFQKLAGAYEIITEARRRKNGGK